MAGRSRQLTGPFQGGSSIPSDLSRNGHLGFKVMETGKAIRDLQAATGMNKGQAVAMLDPKRGSKCQGLKPSLDF